MRRTALFSVAALMSAAIIPLMVYLPARPSNDPLGDKLRSMGFYPIEPPSTLMDVGSLYYVDAGARDFRAICYAPKADLEGLVRESPSWQIEENLKVGGDFAAKAGLNISPQLKGKVSDAYMQTTHFSLTGVVLDEIALGDNGLVYAKLMNNPVCSNVVKQLINLGGYICQSQKVLRARAELKIDRNARNTTTAAAEASLGKNAEGANTESSAQTGRIEVLREGQTIEDEVLTYGAEMYPICLAPKNAHFARTLPRSALDRAYHFILYSIVEPLLPVERSQIDVAENAHSQ